MSGRYALSAFGDAVYYGNLNLGSTLFTPLLVNSYQKACGNNQLKITTTSLEVRRSADIRLTPRVFTVTAGYFILTTTSDGTLQRIGGAKGHKVPRFP